MHNLLPFCQIAQSWGLFSWSYDNLKWCLNATYNAFTQKLWKLLLLLIFGLNFTVINVEIQSPIVNITEKCITDYSYAKNQMAGAFYLEVRNLECHLNPMFDRFTRTNCGEEVQLLIFCLTFKIIIIKINCLVAYIS